MSSNFRKQRNAKKSVNRNRRMSVEPLETRKLLTTLVVDSVGDVNDGNFSPGNFTLREAVGVAQLLEGADTITFDTAGAFATPQHIDLSGGEFDVSESLTIDGPGADQLTLDANGGSRVFNITATDGDFALRGLTLTGGNTSESGGAVRIANGELLVEESVISGNAATSRWGGGIYAESTANLTVSNSTISNNSAAWGGGLLSYGHTTVHDSTISGNSVISGGGGIYVADAVITESTIADNTALSGGGVDTRYGSSITVENSIIASNTASFESDFDLSGVAVNVNYSLIGDAAGAAVGGTGNIVGDSTGSGVVDPLLTTLGNFGGPMQTHGLQTGSPAVNAADPTIQFDAADFDQRGSMFFRVQDGRMDMGAHEDLPVELMVDNSSDVNDGVVSAGEFSLREAVELANFDPGPNTISFDTDGVFAGATQIDLTEGELVITESMTLDGPSADVLTIDAADYSRVFHITASEGDFTIQGMTLTGGNVFGRGGAVQVAAGELTINETTVTENSSSSYGGGVYAPDTANVTLRNSTLSGNTGSFGGGILAYGQLAVENSTVSGNSAQFSGGGIYGIDVTVDSSTITNNTADQGGGIDINSLEFSHTGGSLTVESSILAGNIATSSSPDFVLNPSVTLGVSYSMIGDADGVSISGSGNIVGDSQGSGVVDPQLAPLADNGGPTPTHAPLPGSFVINEGNRFAVAGEEGVPLYDQRGAGFTRVYDGRMDMGAVEVQPSGLPDGDFNDDGLYNCADIDSLVAEIAGGTNDALFDLNGDSAVDLADRDVWLAQAGSVNLPSGNPYHVADANLDGVVDGLDFIVWNVNKFNNSAAWCQGDFNADGFVDGLDFIEWNANKFTSSDFGSVSGDLGTMDQELTAPANADVEPTYPPVSSNVPYRRSEFVSHLASNQYDDAESETERRRIDEVFAAWT